MAGHPGGSAPRQLPPLGLNLESSPQTSSHSTSHKSPYFQQASTGSFSRPTPETIRLLAEDIGSQLAGEAAQTQMSQTLPAPTQAQNFIRTTQILKDTFSRTSAPTDIEMSQLGAQTGLDKYDAFTWFDIMKTWLSDGGAKTLPTPEVTQAYLPQFSSFGNVSEVYSNPLIDLSRPCPVEDFPTWPSQTNSASRYKRSSTSNPRPSKRQRKDKPPQPEKSSLALDNQHDISQRPPDKASGKVQYCCPSCDFTTGRMDQWYTHQSRKHFPPEVFVCGINSRKKPCNRGAEHPFKRKDNFVTHLRAIHGFQQEMLDEEVSKRTVKVTGLFHDKCGFSYCQITLDTREESIKHIGDHIESGGNISDWVHQCTSLDHKIQHHFHFEIPSDEPEMDDDSSNNGDPDQDNFNGGWTQEGDYDPGDGGSPFGADPYQDPGESSSYSGAGGASSAMRFMTAAVSPRVDTSNPVTLPDGVEQDLRPVRPLESLSVRCILGHGGSGTVFEVSHVGSRETFALKRFNSSHAPDFSKGTSALKRLNLSHAPDFLAFKKEVRIMKALRHPHIVEILDSYAQSDSFSILMAPVADMDLDKYLRTTEAKPLEGPALLDRSENLMRGISSIAAALRYIHSSSIYYSVSHGDIKPANILMNKGKWMLADFGISEFVAHGGTLATEKVQVTLEYAASEVIRSGSRSLASDIFSLGCVYAETVTILMNRSLSDFVDFRVTKLGDQSFHATLEKTSQWISMLHEEQERREGSDQAHSIPFDMIRKMLSENPFRRPTAHEVWLRFPKCTCCSDWPATYHQPPSHHDEEEDQAQGVSLTSCTRKYLSTAENPTTPVVSCRACSKEFKGSPQDASSNLRRHMRETHFAGADAKKRRGRAAPPGRCESCNRAETPEWRRGPNGAKTLCNACGLRMCLPYLFKLLIANSLQTTPNLPGKWGLQRRRMEAQHAGMFRLERSITPAHVIGRWILSEFLNKPTALYWGTFRSRTR